MCALYRHGYPTTAPRPPKRETSCGDDVCPHGAPPRYSTAPVNTPLSPTTIHDPTQTAYDSPRLPLDRQSQNGAKTNGDDVCPHGALPRHMFFFMSKPLYTLIERRNRLSHGGNAPHCLPQGSRRAPAGLPQGSRTTSCGTPRHGTAPVYIEI